MSEKFEYKYSAPTQEERKEIESIVNLYAPKDEKSIKLDQLRKLDMKVKNYPLVVSLSLGVIGTLFFGVCLCFFLEWMNLWYVGIPFGIIGIVLISIAYPIYNNLFNKLKNKYGPIIIELSNEIMNKKS